MGSPDADIYTLQQPVPAQAGHSHRLSLVNNNSQTGDTTENSKPPSYTAEDAKQSWRGWAELENDPDIFNTIVHEWGVKNVRVNELYDIALVFERSPSDILGLIFLSRYVPSTEVSEAWSTSVTERHTPWFANQISKFSCGTVALINILMNSSEVDLGTSLSNFRSKTTSQTSKERGIELDDHSEFRDIHNSFATKLDRMIVDLSLKEDVQAARQKSKKAKRKKGRKRRKLIEDEDESGFHFVAYLTANGAVWKLDGVEAEPSCLNILDDTDVAWTQIAAADIQQQMDTAQNYGFSFSLMDVSKADNTDRIESAVDPERMRDDWAPFIEHMIRLHADKGDLASMLGL